MAGGGGSPPENGEDVGKLVLVDEAAAVAVVQFEHGVGELRQVGPLPAVDGTETPSFFLMDLQNNGRKMLRNFRKSYRT